MLRIVADSNIYISALQFGGKPLELLVLGDRREIQLVVSEHIIIEVTRTLQTKFKWPDKQLSHAKNTLSGFVHLVLPTTIVNAVVSDPDDNRILECAIDGEADYIVTGDKDLLRLDRYGHLQILTISEFLNYWKTLS